MDDTNSKIEYQNFKTHDFSILIKVEIGIVEIIGLGAPLGIIGSMFIVLYFSRKQVKGFKLDIKTKVLSDLYERFAS